LLHRAADALSEGITLGAAWWKEYRELTGPVYSWTLEGGWKEPPGPPPVEKYPGELCGLRRILEKWLAH
jgi:hypothetical protein